MSDNKNGLKRLINLFSNHDKNGGSSVHPNATRTQSGFMSPKDKLKVDAILTPQALPARTDLSTLNSGYYNIVDAIGGPEEAYAGSPCYYEIFRVGETRYVEGEQIIMRCYQRSSGMSWEKMFYSNANGTTDKGWSYIVKRQRLLTADEITRLNSGETISLDAKVKDTNQLPSLSISHRYASQLKTMDYLAESVIDIRDFNITEGVPHELYILETQLLFNRTDKTIKLGKKKALKWDDSLKTFSSVDTAVEIVDIFASWYR